MRRNTATPIDALRIAPYGLTNCNLWSWDFSWGVDINLENLNKEVQRKLGRNVLLFQQIEYILKYILIYSDLSVWNSGDGLKSNLEEQKQRFSKLSLGQIAKQFIDSTFSLESDSGEEEAELNYYRVFARIRNSPFVCDIDFFNERKNELAALIDERNELIHHFLPKWNWEDYASLSKAEIYLDQQRERVFPEYELLKSVVESFHSSREELVEYIRSDEFTRVLELDYLRNSQHVARLFEFATINNREDGWAMLSSRP
ncbi:hypothetical protein [Methylomonas fluvii]|uniref:HEPN AbiU2-like domain-containing protein n=1 Tax=Methylomonas fluvii TaxID=1854564 RepID=A0ABR9DGU8_9GAMM|nr:hypothetical protein [Methylomonas fluvii]MBD9361479.1 hypothetical protein [Methylomonas fluvii]